MNPSKELTLSVSIALISDVLDESVLKPLSDSLRDMKITEPKEALRLTDEAINLFLNDYEHSKGVKCTNILRIYDYVVSEICIDKAKEILRNTLNVNLHNISFIQASEISAINDVLIIHPELSDEAKRRMVSVIKD
jgi:hypothetical protein